MMITVRRLTTLIASLCAIVAPLAAQAQSDTNACGGLANGVGPFDYRVDRQHLPIVESAHFTAVVETLIRGSSGSHE